MFRRFHQLVALVAIAGCAPGLHAEVVSDSESKLRVQVTLAESEAARREGLRAYTSLSTGEGLVLVFPGPSEVCITNAGVAFPIDAVFAEVGQVTGVESFDAGEAAVRCHRADEVLEVASGVANRVVPGDRILVE